MSVTNDDVDVDDLNANEKKTRENKIDFGKNDSINNNVNIETNENISDATMNSNFDIVRGKMNATEHSEAHADIDDSKIETPVIRLVPIVKLMKLPTEENQNVGKKIVVITSSDNDSDSDSDHVPLKKYVSNNEIVSISSSSESDHFIPKKISAAKKTNKINKKQIETNNVSQNSTDSSDYEKSRRTTKNQNIKNIVKKKLNSKSSTISESLAPSIPTNIDFSHFSNVRVNVQRLPTDMKKILFVNDHLNTILDDCQKVLVSRETVKTNKNNTDTDSIDENSLLNERKKKKTKILRETSSSESDFEETINKSKSRKKQITSSSDNDSEFNIANHNTTSNESSSDAEMRTTRSQKRKASNKNNSSSEEEKPKKKLKRIKRVASDSDDSDDLSSDNKKRNKFNKRKKIKKIIEDKNLEKETLEAAEAEQERMKRIAERQKLYNESFILGSDDINGLDHFVLDFDDTTKKELLTVDKDLLKILKPHQINGIKFMWDACFESLAKIQKSQGNGCILAHCMGLGKTLQVIALCHTLLCNDDKTNVHKVLIICPVSTILNWVNEFDKWLNGRDYEVYEMTQSKSNYDRLHCLKDWHKHGGVMVMGYDAFRRLTLDTIKETKNTKLQLQKCLLDPGADLVVCDEGHLLKNSKAAISKAVNRIQTKRRIVLTGTPLQNNLKEYYCMVQFVKPNLLGSYIEYLNRFVNPITNGQYYDSTTYDIQMMKRRSHILHKLLEGSVQRQDYSMLAPFLSAKHEYVLYVRLTPLQVKLYQYYYTTRPLRTENTATKLFQDFQIFQRICSHVKALRLNSDEYDEKLLKNLVEDDDEEDEVGSLKDFVVDESDVSDTCSESENDNSKSSISSNKSVKVYKTRRKALEMGEVSTIEKLPKQRNITEWWMSMCSEEDLDNMEHSNKLQLLFKIIAECEEIGDKLLVFSQSLYTLDVIEHFLELIDDNTQNPNENAKLCGFKGSWARGLDYYRLDGKMAVAQRENACRSFNSSQNSRARLFLISTKAGGLGINLVAANRVVIFDACWNPSHDIQSIYRVYRFGQMKPCYIYRFIAYGTMEERIYERQITKLATSKRVVDEHQISRHFRQSDIDELYRANLEPIGDRPEPNLPKDRLLAELIRLPSSEIWKYLEHDSLLENKTDENLTREEVDTAWQEYENERKAQTMRMNAATTTLDGTGIKQLDTHKILPSHILAPLLRLKALKDYPGYNNEQILSMIPMLREKLTQDLQANNKELYNELVALSEAYKVQQLQKKIKSDIICGFDRPVLEAILAAYIRSTDPYISDNQLTQQTQQLIHRLVTERQNEVTTFYDEIIAFDQQQHSQAIYRNGQQKMAEYVRNQKLQNLQKQQQQQQAEHNNQDLTKHFQPSNNLNDYQNYETSETVCIDD